MIVQILLQWRNKKKRQQQQNEKDDIIQSSAREREREELDHKISSVWYDWQQ